MAKQKDSRQKEKDSWQKKMLLYKRSQSEMPVSYCGRELPQKKIMGVLVKPFRSGFGTL